MARNVPLSMAGGPSRSVTRPPASSTMTHRRRGVPRRQARPRPSPRRRPRRRARSPRSRRSRARARRRAAAPSKPGARPRRDRCPGREPYRTWASASEVTPRHAGSAAAPRPGSAAHAPPPRQAHQRSSSAGARHDADAWSSPSRSTASRVPNSGTPRMKLWVPSIGSMYQRTRRVAGLGAVLLADQAVIREGVGEPLADAPLDRRVGLGDERAVGLRLDDQVAAEVRRARSRRPRRRRPERDVEPAAQLGVGPAPEPADHSVPYVASLTTGSARRSGPTAARARPRSRPTRRRPRPRRASRSPPSGGR